MCTYLGTIKGEGEGVEREINCKLVSSSMFDQSPFLSNARTDPYMTSEHRFWCPNGLCGAVSNRTQLISQLVRFDGTLTLTSACKHVTCCRRGSSSLWVKQTKSSQFVNTIAYWLFLLKFADEVSIRATAVFCVSEQHSSVSLLNEFTLLNE